MTSPNRTCLPTIHRPRGRPRTRYPSTKTPDSYTAARRYGQVWHDWIATRWPYGATAQDICQDLCHPCEKTAEVLAHWPELHQYYLADAMVSIIEKTSMRRGYEVPIEEFHHYGKQLALLLRIMQWWGDGSRMLRCGPESRAAIWVARDHI